MNRSEKNYDTIIIGAGQAGLASAYYLRQAGRDFLILEHHGRIGDNWRQRWEGLRLFSPQRYNSLPGLAPDGGPWHLPDRLELADYLEGYARHFAFPVLPNCTCVRARKSAAGKWELETSQGILKAENLIVATGAYRTPSIPTALSSMFPETITQIHSSEIHQIETIADDQTDALVIGAGASGQQISRLLAAAGAAVILAGPTVANLPRTFLGKDIYWWLYHSGMMTLRTDRWPGKMLLNDGVGDVTVGEPPLPETIGRLPTELVSYKDHHLHFNCQKTVPSPVRWPEDGRKGLVVWCSGFRNNYPFLPEEMLDEKGQPLHTGGVSKEDKTLVFVGLPNLRRPNSSLVGGVGADAEYVVSQLE